MERRKQISRLLSEAVLVFALAVLLDVAHLVLMARVPGYPRSNAVGMLTFWIPPAVLVLIPIRTYVLLRSAWLTAAAFLAAAVGAIVAIYIALVGAYILVGVSKNLIVWVLTVFGRLIPDTSFERHVASRATRLNPDPLGRSVTSASHTRWFHAAKHEQQDPTTQRRTWRPAHLLCAATRRRCRANGGISLAESRGLRCALGKEHSG